MLGRFLVAAITGLVVWKYRDSLREYAKGNLEPAREKVDGLLRTVQSTSEVLLDQAKEQLSSRLGSVREKVRVSGSETRETDRRAPTVARHCRALGRCPSGKWEELTPRKCCKGSPKAAPGTGPRRLRVVGLSSTPPYLYGTPESHRRGSTGRHASASETLSAYFR